VSTSLVIVTHDLIGKELLHSTGTILGKQDIPVYNISVTHHDNPDKILDTISKLIESIDKKHDILIMTDLYGATPCNIVNRISAQKRIRIITGINLSMLIKAFNYANTLPIEQLAEKVTNGGQQGIFVCPTE